MSLPSPTVVVSLARDSGRRTAGASRDSLSKWMPKTTAGTEAAIGRKPSGKSLRCDNHLSVPVANAAHCTALQPWHVAAPPRSRAAASQQLGRVRSAAIGSLQHLHTLAEPAPGSTEEIDPAVRIPQARHDIETVPVVGRGTSLRRPPHETVQGLGTLHAARPSDAIALLLARFRYRGGAQRNRESHCSIDHPGTVSNDTVGGRPSIEGADAKVDIRPMSWRHPIDVAHSECAQCRVGDPGHSRRRLYCRGQRGCTRHPGRRLGPKGRGPGQKRANESEP